jgi:uncharacterized protein YeaO (DUF488 family)
MPISTKRVYDAAEPTDGYRVLVDRLWPRGLSKATLKMDAWMKDIAPSPELRRWFAHDESKWVQFQKRYAKELDGHADLVRELRERARGARLTLLYAARDELHNSAALLKKYLERGTA